ncbi:MAG: thioredoxin [Bacteroidota bacterium]
MSTATNVLELTDANFQESVLQSSKPVLVDYWATWCGPCKMLSPVIEELAGEMDAAVFGKMDVQKNTTGTKFGVMALPTLMIFKDGKKVDALTGVPSKAKIKETLEKYV